jgi:hypothetical protein
MSMEYWRNDNDRRKSKYSEKNLSLKNLTRTGSRSKPRFRAERPSTELPSLGAAFKDKSNFNFI